MVPWGSLEVLHIAQRVTSGLSLIGSSTVCFLFFYLRWWESSTHHVILFYISLADIVYSTTFLIGPMAFSSADYCTFQGWKAHMFGLAIQIWCTFLGLNLLLQMKFFWDDRRCRATVVKYHAIAWGIPFILATIPAAQNFMVPLGTFCWIKSEEPGWRFWTLYIPLWINFGINFYIIFKIIRLLRQVLASLPEGMSSADKIKGHYRFVTCQTLMFVFAGMICWSVSTINRILQAFGVHDQDIPFEMFFFQGLLLPLQGIFNLLVYVAPVHLQQFCCHKGDRDNEKTVATDNYSFQDFPNLEEAIPELEVSESTYEEVEDDSKERHSTNPKRTVTMQKFRRHYESMTFYDGPGRLGVEIVRQRLSARPSLQKL